MRDANASSRGTTIIIIITYDRVRSDRSVAASWRPSIERARVPTSANLGDVAPSAAYASAIATVSDREKRALSLSLLTYLERAIYF